MAPAIALELADADWELGPGPGSKGTGNLWGEWMEMKWSTVWGYLPNLKTPGPTIGNELSILQYLARKFPAVGGATDEDFVVSQEILHQAEEVYQKLTSNCPTIMAQDKSPEVFNNFMTNADKNTHSSQQGLPVYLDQFESCSWLADGKFTSSGTSVGECKLFATLHICVLIKADVLSGHPKLSAFYSKFGSNPKVKAVVTGTAKNMSGQQWVQYFIAPPK